MNLLEKRTIIKLLKERNPECKFWIDADRDWIMTDAYIYKLKLRPNWKYVTHAGKTFIKIFKGRSKSGFDCYQIVDIVNQNGRNLNPYGLKG